MNKQGKSRLYIFLIIILVSVAIVIAANTHTLNIPADESWVKKLNVNFSGTCTGPDGVYNVSTYFMQSTGWTRNATLNDSFTNNTMWSNLSRGYLNFSSDNYTGITWNAICYGGGGEVGANASWLSGGNFTIYVDGTDPVVNNRYPLANTYWGNQTDIYFKTKGNETNPSSCYLWHNMSGTWSLNDTQVFVNATDITFDPVSPIGYEGLNVTWNTYCEDKSGNINRGTNRTILVDYTAPGLAVSNYTNEWWVNSYDTGSCLPGGVCNITLAATISDFYPDSCELWTDVAGTGFILNNTQTTITNGSILGFTTLESIAANNSGISYNMWCNDSSGLSTWLRTDGNYSLFIDTKVPGYVTINIPTNDSTIADLIPSLNWTNSSDANFESYILQASDTTTFTTLWIDEAVTTNHSTNQTTTVLDLTGNITDQTMFVRINTTDDANQGNMSLVYQINFKQSCSVLEAGEYSYCSIVRDANISGANGVSMAQIGIETGASYVYKWLSNHTWLTHTVGSTTNQYENFSRGDVAVLYVATADGNQSWNGKRLWSLNLTNAGHVTKNFNFTNQSSSKWNLVPWINLSDINFHDIFTSMNTSIPGTWNRTGDNNATYFSYPNWNGSGLRYLGYVWGKESPWNITDIESGTAFWAAWEVTKAGEWNWTLGG